MNSNTRDTSRPVLRQVKNYLESEIEVASNGTLGHIGHIVLKAADLNKQPIQTWQVLPILKEEVRLNRGWRQL